MRTCIVRIGRSQGIRIPKRLLDQTGLNGEVEITAVGKMLVIGAAVKPRAGGAALFRKMARKGDDALLDEVAPSLSTWDDDEWQW